MSIWRNLRGGATSAPKSGAPATPAPAKRNRRRVGTSILAAGLAGLLAISAAVLGAGPAAAAAAPVVYDKVEITGTPPAHIGDVFRMHVEWHIADGAAVAGDTYEIELDPALRGIPTSFDATNPGGEAVATCQVRVVNQGSADERSYVTCTFTDFVTSHPNNVSGTLDFSAAAIAAASEYNIVGKIVGIPTPIPPDGGGGGGGGGDWTQEMPQFSKTGAVYQDGTIGFQVKIPYSILTAGGGTDVTIVDNYDSALPAPTRIHLDRENTGLNPPAATPLTQGTGPGQYTLTMDDANHRFTIVYHDVSTISSTQFLKLDYSFTPTANTPAGTPFDNEVTVGSETKTVQVVYNVGGSGTGDGASRGRARVTKVDAADSSRVLAGAKFNILDSTNTVVGSFGPTGTDGKAVSGQFNPGEYTIVETSAPDGYELDQTPHRVTLVAGTTTPITINNARLSKGSVDIAKSITGDAAGSVPAGTEFKVGYAYTDNGVAKTGTLTVTNGGTATLADVPAGTVVTFTEVTPTAIAGATWGTPVFSGTGVTQTGTSATVTVAANSTVRVALENPINTNPAPAIDLVKTADHDTYAAGDTITYTFVATNTGNTVLSNVKISETAFNGGAMSAMSCVPAQPTSLAPGAKLTCTATYVATQADVDRGNLKNTAKVVGTPPTGPDVTDNDTVTINGDQNSSIDLVKTADKTKVVAGQTVTYTFVATNTGNTTLSNVKISETAFNGSGSMSALTCDPSQPATLTPGSVLTCTATYVVKQADVDRGNLTNTAKVVGTPPSGPDVTDNDGVTINGDLTPAIDLVKTADRSTYSAGDTVKYTFVATNTGNTSLSGVTISETAFNGGAMSGLSCIPAMPASLAPGANLTCTATYVATQADVDRGNLANSAHVVGTPPSGPEVTDDDHVTITGSQNPAIDLTKTADRTKFAAGDTVTYTFVATNTGNTTLSNVKISETAFNGGAMSALSCAPAQPASLAVGAKLTCTATYVATQADADRGNLANSAHVVGTPPSGPEVTDDDQVTITSDQASSIDLVKTADHDTFAAGDTITYTFVATNTGNTTLSNVKISETAFNGGAMSAMSCVPAQPTSLAPAAKLTCTATYVATQADVDRGNLKNTAKVVGTPPTGPDVTDNDTVTINGDQNSSIDLVKTADKTKVVAGQTVTYTFVATNTGNTTLSNVKISETAFNGGAMSALTCDPSQPATLTPGSVLTCTATYVVKQTDVDRGNLANTAKVVGTPPSGPDVTDNDGVTINGDLTPAIDLVKTADRSTYVAGDTVRYTFVATNTGNTSLSGVTISETAFNGGAMSGMSCTPAMPASLAPGANLTCTATYVATQADVDRGNLANSAHVVGTPPSGPDVTDDDQVTINGNNTSAIDLVKTADRTKYAAGDTVGYTFVATNTGNTTLSNVTISETAFNGGAMSALACTPAMPASLAPGAKLTCTATYLATQADADRGNLANSAHVVGTPPTGPEVTDDDQVTITSDQVPSIDLVKTADHNDYAVGDTITYTFVATNTGNATLSNVKISETAFNGGTMSALDCNPAQPATMAPGAKLTCTATYVATQADVDRGNLANTAKVVGTPPSGPDVTDSDGVTINGDQNSSIDLVKTADKSEVVAGQTVTYTFVATNTGNTTLSAVKISETAFNGGAMSAMSCDPAQPASLAPGAKLTCTATYVVKQADVDRGNLANTAKVVGTPPSGPDVTDNDGVTINGEQTPAIDLVKTADRSTYSAGDTVKYTFVATNTGNTTLTNVTISETAFNGGAMSGLSCIPAMPASLTPGANLTCTATYVTTQADLDRGNLANSAHVVGTPPSGPEVTDDDQVTITGSQNPAIDLTKTADRTKFAAGDTVKYTFVATNTGNTTLSNVTISETAFNGGPMSALTCAPAMPASLAPGAKLTCAATYLATQDDVDRGDLANSAHVVGTPPTGPDVTDDDQVTITSDQNPAIDLVKTADHDTYAVGDTITYTFVATNTGNTTLRDVKISDTKFNGSDKLSALACNPDDPATLAPGAKLTCTATYVATQADLDRGNLANTAKAVGTPPTGPDVTDDDQVTIDGDQNPSIDLVKTADKTKVVARETVTYTFTATNTGNVTLSDVTISDAEFNGAGELSALTCDPDQPASLAPGDVLTCTATYVVKQADVDRGNLANSADVVGTPPSGPDVTDHDEVTINGDQNPQIDLIKTADRSSYVAGDNVKYTMLATNTGNVTLNNVTISETEFNGGELSALSCDPAMPASLAPGDALTCTATYVATQADVDRGNLANRAHVVGTPPTGPDVTDDDGVTINGDQLASLSLEKRVAAVVDKNQDHVTDAGDTIQWEFDLTNTGHVTLASVKVDDDLLAKLGIGITCPAEPLAPGAKVTCVADREYVITEADASAGRVVNTAVAHGSNPLGEDVITNQDTTVTTVTTPIAVLGVEDEVPGHDLAFTGFDNGWMLGAGGLLVALGAGFILVTRRRRADQNS